MVSPVALTEPYAVRPFEELSHGGALLAALRDRVPEAVGGLARPEIPVGPAPAVSRPEQDLFLGLPPSGRTACLERYLAFSRRDPLGGKVNLLA